MQDCNCNYEPMIPFMPLDPQMANAYVPYQLDVEEFDLQEAVQKGSLFVNIFDDYIGNVKGDQQLCQQCAKMK